MKIKKYVQFEQEIEIDISSTDIQTTFDSDTESKSIGHIPFLFNDVATFLRGVSASRIAEMTDGQRTAINLFLLTEAERYK